MSDDEKKFHFLTWEHAIDLLKVVATVYVACIGTFVTMQFNERQHELARIEAIAQLLPNLAAHEASSPGHSKSGATSQSEDEAKSSTGAKNNTTAKENQLVRDGTMWAIFRTAQNKTMLRDLAALFPEDVYRVISSIAAAGQLQDEDAIIAMQVASEKLAGQYTNEKDSEIAVRLYNQALRLKRHTAGEMTPVYIVDLTEREEDAPQGDDKTLQLVESLNSLADLHLQESEGAKHLNTGHWEAKQSFKKARELGKASHSKAVLLEVVKADEGLAELYRAEKRFASAADYLREAIAHQEEATGKESKEVGNLYLKLGEMMRLHEPESSEPQKMIERGKTILQKAEKT